jgi:hypothetical protein
VCAGFEFGLAPVGVVLVPPALLSPKRSSQRAGAFNYRYYRGEGALAVGTYRWLYNKSYLTVLFRYYFATQGFSAFVRLIYFIVTESPGLGTGVRFNEQ